ncbi:MAG: HYR domain-containing protein, partial [Chloroflexi bacterium]|nr:HYR domain-containing protein [Chloroflexota bacterium]
NTAPCQHKVIVNDCENPWVTCPGNITVNNDPGKCGAVVTYTVTYGDNCPGAILSQMEGLPSGAMFPVGTTTNTFVVTDAAGNTASCSFTVTVVDNEPPVLTCPPDKNVSTDPGKCYATVDPGLATATDNCPGVTVVGVRSDGKPLDEPYPKGVTTITWTARDTAGNETSCVQ